MLERQDQSVPTVLRALSRLGDLRALKKVLLFVKSENNDVKAAAIEAAANLTDAKHSEAVGAFIRKHASGHDDTIANFAAKALQTLYDQKVISGEEAYFQSFDKSKFERFKAAS